MIDDKKLVDNDKNLTDEENKDINNAPDKTIEEHQEDFVCSAEFEDGCKEVDS